jgi:hypothetical protein
LLCSAEPKAASERALEALDVTRRYGRREAEGPLRVNLVVAYRELGRLHEAADSARVAIACNP